MAQYYDRYKDFRIENSVKTMPFIKISERSTDKKTKIKKTSRLDIISYEVYGSPYYGWVILQANPQYGSLESDLPIGKVVRVPFPLTPVLQEIEKQISIFDSLYGI